MPGALQVDQPHDRDQVAEMKAVGSRIEPAVAGDLASAQRFVSALRLLMEQPPPSELFEKRSGCHDQR